MDDAKVSWRRSTGWRRAGLRPSFGTRTAQATPRWLARPAGGALCSAAIGGRHWPRGRTCLGDGREGTCPDRDSGVGR